MKQASVFIVIVVTALSIIGCKGTKNAVSLNSKKHQTTDADKKEVDKLAVDQVFIDATKAKITDDQQTAAEKYKEVLKLDPQNDAAQYELSAIYFNSGQNELAKLLINSAVINDSINYVQNFVETARKKDSTSNIKNITAKAASSYKPNKWYLVLQADIYTSLADYDKSTKIYSKLLAVYPTEVDYYFDWAYVLTKSGKYAEALKTLEKLESLVGLDESIIIQKQKLYLQMGQMDKAVAEVQRLIDSDKDNIRYYQLLAEIYQANDKLDDALKVFQNLLRISPGNPYALLSVAETYRIKGDRVKYMEYLKQAFASTDLNVDSKIRVLFPYLNTVKSDTVKKEEAFTLARIMIETHPQDARAHAIFGDLLYQDKQNDDALHQYKQSLELDSSTFEVWQQVFFIQADLKKYAELAASTEKALELFPNQALVYFFNGLAYNQLKDYQKAVASLTTGKNLSIDNKNLKIQIYSTLGDVYNSMTEYTKSDNAYDSALGMDKNNAYVLNNYSYYLSLRNEKIDKAKTMSMRSNELEPTNGSYQDTYAWVLFRAGDYAEARKWMEKAIASGEENNPTIQEHYGDILYKLGEVAKALECWQKAAKLGSDSKLLEKKIADKKLYE